MWGVASRLRRWIRHLVSRLLRRVCLGIVEESLPIVAQLVRYQESQPSERMSSYNRTDDPLANEDYFAGLKEDLIALGVPVEVTRVDRDDFARWLNGFPLIARHYESLGDVWIEKCLEHYLVHRLMDISAVDTYIDVAACGSPWAGILRRKGIRAYRLDLRYPKGVHGIDIGADASATQLPDGFATVLSAQCAYECFEGDADIGFVQEASRILAPTGRYAIIPLYLDDTHYVALSPHIDQAERAVEADARKVWRDDGRRSPFSRHYSPEAFKVRIFDNIPADMQGKIVFFSNLPELMRSYPGQRVYCFFAFVCSKKGNIGQDRQRGVS